MAQQPSTPKPAAPVQASWSRLEGLILHWGATDSAGGAWGLPPQGWAASPNKVTDAGERKVGAEARVYVVMVVVREWFVDEARSDQSPHRLDGSARFLDGCRRLPVRRRAPDDGAEVQCCMPSRSELGPARCGLLWSAGGAWQCGFEKQNVSGPEGNAAVYVLLLQVRW